MNIQEFYESIGEDYESLIKRLPYPEKIKKYVLMFANDESLSVANKALEEKDYETAFREIHTLKGVSSNLSFEKLHNLASTITEALRGGILKYDVSKLMNELNEEYDLIQANISQID